jgi:hypothetical protein
MKPFAGRTLYLVQEVWWQVDEESPSPHGRWRCIDPMFGKPLLAFTSREAAEADAARRERLERAERNPFCHGRTTQERTSMPEEVLCDWLTDAGIDPPGIDEDDDWAAWWVSIADDLSELQRDKAWEALDLVRFFRVIALSPPTK